MPGRDGRYHINKRIPLHCWKPDVCLYGLWSSSIVMFGSEPPLTGAFSLLWELYPVRWVSFANFIVLPCGPVRMSKGSRSLSRSYWSLALGVSLSHEPLRTRSASSRMACMMNSFQYDLHRLNLPVSQDNDCVQVFGEESLSPYDHIHSK